MNAHPPSIMERFYILFLTVLAGLLIVAGIVAAMVSSCIEVGGPVIESVAVTTPLALKTDVS